jgi:hypothetical protein
MNNFFQFPSWRLAAVVLLCALTAMTLSAQTAPYLGAGTTEINGFGGLSYGLDKWRGSFGGNAGHWVTTWLMPYGEFSYFPGINRNISVPVGGANEFATGRQAVKFADIHGGVHVRKALSNNFVPYAVFGVGEVHGFKRTANLNFPIAPGVTRPRDVEVPSSNDLAVNGGVGLRIYTKESFGFRVEYKIYKPTGTYTDPFYKLVFGIFGYIKK